MGRIARKKPMLTPSHKLRRLRFAKMYKYCTKEDWEKVLWTNEALFSVVGQCDKMYVRRRVGNVQSFESENRPNPGKILGLTWYKQDDVLEIQGPEPDSEQRITKKSILSHLAGIYDPLGVISPTVVEGKHIYRQACDGSKTWDSEVSTVLAKDWLKWTRQLRNVRIPRSVIRECKKVKAVDLHLFADASNLACSAMTISVAEQDTRTVKGFLTSKSRISKRNTSIARSELISGQWQLIWREMLLTR